MKEPMNSFFGNIVKQDGARKRNKAVDCLRAIALISIFLLHASPSKDINALLQFCVPAMVFLSGICYHGSISSAKEYAAYVKKRFFRIAAPAAVFALVFGIAVDAFCLVSKRSLLFSAKDILTGVILYDGIGYVWIMRIFFLIALLAPLAEKINHIQSDTLYIGCCLAIYAAYRLIFRFVPESTFLYDVLYYFLFETMPYLLVWMTGFRYAKMKRGGKIGVVLFCLLIFGGCLMASGWDVSVIRSTKYPPEAAYLTYGIVITILLYEILNKVFSGRDKNNLLTGIICFLSSKSNELYLAHIPFVYFIFMIETSHSLPFALKFGFIVCAAVITTGIYLLLSEKIKKALKK